MHFVPRILTKMLPILFCASCIAWAQQPGIITGAVLDDNGMPVEGATVSVQRTDRIEGRRLPSSIISRPDGKFTVLNLPPGSYALFAGKEDAGYPDTYSTFYKPGPTPTATLTRLSPEQNVNVYVAKAASFILPTVKDSQTHRDISVSALIALCRTDIPKTCLWASAAQTHFLVPIKSPIQVEISAPGYKAFKTVLEAKVGEVLTVNAELEPVSSNPTVSDVLMRLGRDNNAFFTLEEASRPVDGVTPMRAYRPALSPAKDLSSVLENLQRVVPHFSYQVNPQEPRIFHILDDRLIGQKGYALGQKIDHLKFNGRGSEFISAVCMPEPRLFWIEIPGPFDLVDVDLKRNVNVNLDQTERRDALSLLSSSDGRGGLLWMARTDIGANQSTVVTFCCAPRLQ